MARLLQIVGLAGFPAGAFIAAGVGGLVAAGSLSVVYVGLAFEKRGS